MMMNNVGTYKAKTHLSKLLERVEKGEQFIITRHGIPIARLMPPNRPSIMTTSDAVAELKNCGRTVPLAGCRFVQ
jgi:prevent-host-death family protein